MFLGSSRAKAWRRLTLGFGSVLVAGYLLFGRGAGFAHGGSSVGLTYGALAFLLILILLFFGVRKRWYRSRWGTLEGWLQAHLYLGALSVVAVLLHSGWRFADRVAVGALAVLLLVVLTGIVGALLYQALPRRLSSVESDLTAEESSRELNRLARSMARLAQGRSPAFRALHASLEAEGRPGRLAGWRILFAPRVTPGSESRDRALEIRRVPADEQESLRELLVLSRQHKELQGRLVAQERYRNLLDVWLYAHIPLSLALLVLVLVHAVAGLYYRGW